MCIKGLQGIAGPKGPPGWVGSDGRKVRKSIFLSNTAIFIISFFLMHNIMFSVFFPFCHNFSKHTKSEHFLLKNVIF